jgi:hypothetical protein
MNNKRIKYLFVLGCFAFFLLGCRNKNLRNEKGFIVFIDPQYWYYVPAINLNDGNYLNQFNSNNLGYGIQFRPFFEGRNRIMENLHTIRIDSVQRGLAPYLYTLKITPVEVEYEIAAEKISLSSIFKFASKIRGDEVVFKFNTLPISIKHIRPLPGLSN